MSADGSLLWRATPAPRDAAWWERVNEPFSSGDLWRLRHSVRRGRPFGNDDWTRPTAQALGLEFSLRKPGRPKSSGTRYVPLFFALFHRIDRSVSWNAPKNAPAMRATVDQFLNPSVGPKSRDGFALPHFASNSWVLNDRTLRQDEISDGLSQKILAEDAAGDFQPWGSPYNLRDPALGINRSKSGFCSSTQQSHFRPRCLFLFADGSIQSIRADVDRRVLRAMATPAGTETVPE